MKSWKKKQEKKQLPKGMKISLCLLVALLAAGAVSIIAYQKLHIRRPASDKREDIMKFVASSDFKRLSFAERQEWLKKLRPEKGEKRPTPPNRDAMRTMSQEERSAFRDNMRQVFEQERNKHMKQYFALQTQEEKNAFLDAEIAKMEERRAEFEERRAQMEAERKKRQAENKNGTADPDRPPRPTEAQRTARMKTRTETTSPETRAMRNRYMRELQARAKATGKNISPPRPRMAAR